MREWLSRVFALGRHGRRDRELAEELQFHLEALASAHERRGLSPREARQEAEREMGGSERTRQAWRDQRTWLPAEEVRQDVTFGWRVLRRSPGFTLPAVLTLALAVAATTSVFTIVDAVLLAPLPVGKAEQVVFLYESYLPEGVGKMNVAPGNFLEWQARVRALSSLTAIDSRQQNLTGNGEPQQVAVRAVSDGFAVTTGVQPMVGRLFRPEEFQPGHDDVAILDHGLWQSRYHGDQAVIGSSIVLDDRPYVVIGVMPSGFIFPMPGSELWVPLSFGSAERENRTGHTLAATARLRDGVTIDAARRELDAAAAALQREFPDQNRGWGIAVESARDAIVGDTKPVLATVTIAVWLLLLVACANIAGLLLTHGASRDREVAVRLALGADRRRMIRQFLVESLLLATAGGALGLVLTEMTRPLVAALQPADFVTWKPIAVDARAIVFAAATSVIAALLFGLLPAVVLSDRRIGQRASARAGGGASRARLLLIGFEVALAVMLACGAAVLGRTLTRLTATDLGFQPQGIVTMRVSLPVSRYGEDHLVRAFYDNTLERIRALPGVRAAGATHMLALSGGSSSRPYRLEGQVIVNPLDQPVAHYRIVTDGYLEAMRIPLRLGRMFNRGDQPDRPLVVIVNETFRRRAWGERNPIGQRITFGGSGDLWAEVVGVVGDVLHFGPGTSTPPEMYWMAPQIDAVPGATLKRARRGLTLMVATDGDPAGIVASVRSAVQSVDPDQPLASIRTMSSMLSSALWLSRASAWLVAVFGSAALGFALLGVFGAVSYGVTQRRRELALRLALGATASSLKRLVLANILTATAVGLAVGVIATLGLQAGLSKLIVDAQPLSATLFILVVGGCTGLVLLACWLPARRAARIEPMQVLRME